MRKIILFGVILGLIGIPPASGQTAQGINSNVTISMDVTDAHIEDVLKLLSKQSGISFIASQEVRNLTVTTYLDQVPVQDAINSLLSAYRLSLRRRGSENLFVVVESSAPLIETVTKVFYLKYARVIPSAGEVLRSFGLSGSLIQQTLSSAEVGGSGSSTGSIGTSIQGDEETGILSIIRSLLTEYGSVVADPRTNAVIITDIAEQFPVIEETIEKLDIKPQQIYIEAEVMEVTLDTLRRIGLEFGDSSGQLATFTGPARTTAFPFSQSLLTGGSRTDTLGTLSFTDTNVLLKLIATETDVKFLARPRLLTLSGEVAEIQIVEDTSSGLVTTSQSDTGTITESVERSTVGTVLRVTPIVNDDKYITMVIEPEVSRVVASTKFSNFLDPNRRAARTTVMIQDGGTAMIAGLISTEDTKSTRRIPGLGDIPLLGIPFKRNSTEQEHTEVIIFITPTIVREGDSKLDWDALLYQERELDPLDSKTSIALERYRYKKTRQRAMNQTFELLTR